MFWELYQLRLINKADRKANRAQLKADHTVMAMERLESKIESLALACQSLWEILRENTDLTEAELDEKMQEIDLRDGRLDGKLSKVADDCSKCGRRTSRRRPNCIYCGEPTDGSEVFGRN